MRKVLLIALFAMLGASAAFSQKQIKGVVFDDNDNETLPGVSVSIKGTTTGIITNVDGGFTITAPSEESVLRFSYIGYETQEVAVKSLPSGDLSIRLKSSATSLGDVVVTGYQTIAREKVTGAVTTVSSGALNTRVTQNITQNMEGRVAGLVNYNGQLTIRGVSSLSAVTTPLMVVDGMPIEGDINNLNSYDIESVTVLKDAAAAAIYGARAANGIIVITTKKARETGTSVELSANYSITQKRNVDYADNHYLTPAQQVDMESAYYNWRFNEYPLEGGPDPIAEFQQQFIQNNNTINPIQNEYYRLALGEITQGDLDNYLNGLKKNNYAKDYAKAALRAQFQSQYNVAVRTKGNKFSSSFVANLKTNNGGVVKSSDTQGNFTFKGDWQMAKWVSFNFEMNSYLQKIDQSNSSWLSPSTDPFSEPAYYSLYNADGSLSNMARQSNDYNELGAGYRPLYYNPIQEFDHDRIRTDRTNMRYQGALKFNIIDGLSATASFIYETQRYTQTAYADFDSYVMRYMRNIYTTDNGDGTYSYAIPENGGKQSSDNFKRDDWTVRGQVDYNKTFAQKHALSVLAGLEFRQTLSNGTRSLLLGYDDQLQVSGMSAENLQYLYDTQTQNSTFYNKTYNGLYSTFIQPYLGLFNETLHRYASGYANATYTYDNKYNAFASLRKDYADVYGLDSKYRGKPLWSVGASWIATNEDFMRNLNWLDFLKVRASYGVTGNIYQNATSYMTSQTAGNLNHWRQPYATINSPANPYLTWEKAATTNVGIDFGLFSNKLHGSLDYYYKKSSNVFANKRIESTFGFASMFMNTAELYNDGVEATLAYQWITQSEHNPFSLSTTITGAYNHNKVTAVDTEATTAQGLAGSSTETGQFMAGYPVNALWSYKFAGLDETGVRTWYSNDGSKQTSSTIGTVPASALVYSGQKDPKVSMSMDNAFRYNNFTLEVMMVYYGGHKMRALPVSSVAYPQLAAPMPSFLLRGWTPENTNTDVPGVLQYNTGAASTVADLYTDRYVISADFIKIRNIVLSYDFDRSLISRLGMTSASVRLQIDNPITIWKANSVGIDPETGGVRLPASYILGLNINF